MPTHDPAGFHLALAVTVAVIVATIALTIWFSERSYRALRHAIIQGQLELQRGTRELQHGTERLQAGYERLQAGYERLQEGQERLQEGQAEIKRLEIVIGGMVYQEDERTRALITARFEEMLARLPR